MHASTPPTHPHPSTCLPTYFHRRKHTQAHIFYIHACIHNTYFQTYIPSYMPTNIHRQNTHIHTYTHAYIHACIRACIHKCTHICMCICVYIYIQTHTETDRQTDRQTDAPCTSAHTDAHILLLQKEDFFLGKGGTGTTAGVGGMLLFGGVGRQQEEAGVLSLLRTEGQEQQGGVLSLVGEGGGRRRTTEGGSGGKSLFAKRGGGQQPPHPTPLSVSLFLCFFPSCLSSQIPCFLPPLAPSFLRILPFFLPGFNRGRTSVVTRQGASPPDPLLGDLQHSHPRLRKLQRCLHDHAFG